MGVWVVFIMTGLDFRLRSKPCGHYTRQTRAASVGARVSFSISANP
jgi:hypothetical protein